MSYKVIKSHETCLTNRTRPISHHIMPLVINALRDGHTDTHTNTDARTKTISRNRARVAFSRACLVYNLSIPPNVIIVNFSGYKVYWEMVHRLKNQFCLYYLHNSTLTLVYKNSGYVPMIFATEHSIHLCSTEAVKA